MQWLVGWETAFHMFTAREWAKAMFLAAIGGKETAFWELIPTGGAEKTTFWIFFGTTGANGLKPSFPPAPGVGKRQFGGLWTQFGGLWSETNFPTTGGLGNSILEVYERK